MTSRFLLTTILAGFILVGCAEKEYSVKTNAEIYPDTVFAKTEIKSHSLMQQMMDAAENHKIKMFFTPSSSDRIVGAVSDGNIFSVLANASPQTNRAVSIKTLTDGTKKVSIQPQEPSITKLKAGGPDFTAVKSIEGKMPLGSTVISVAPDIEAKVLSLAKTYDENKHAFGGGEKGLYDFASYLSSWFGATKQELFFDYDKKNDIFFLSSMPTIIELSPHKIFDLKKRLESEGIEYKPVKNYGISVGSGFANWVRAFSLAEEMDPHKGQVYLVSSSVFGTFTLPEGYDPKRNLNIEFEGWNADGSRSYLLYTDYGIRKITTSDRNIRISDNGVTLKVKFF